MLLAGLGFKGKKEAKRKQAVVISNVDQMVDAAQNLYEVEDSFKSAIDILKEAYFLADQANYTKGIIASANLLGKGYLASMDYSNATSKYYIAMRHAETINDSSSMSKAFQGLGLVKYNMNQWAEAISDFNKSREMSQVALNKRDGSVIDYLLGLSYYNLGKYEVSESFLFKAREVAASAGNNMRLLEIKLHLNNIEVERSNSPMVIKVYDELIFDFQALNEKIAMCYATLGKAKSYLKSADYQNSSKFTLEALAMARNSEINYPVQEVLAVAIETEYFNGRYKVSSDYMRELQNLKEATLSQNTSTKVAMMSADYQFEKKEEKFNDEINARNKQRMLLLILVIAFFLISLIVFLSLRGVAKERHRSDQLLYNILPVETAKELKANGVAVAKAHAEVTIVFADVEGFTRIAGNLEPTVLVQLLDFYFGQFDRIIQAHGLEKIKTIGDAYMFVSGLDSDKKENASNAVSAGLDMLQAIKEAEAEMMQKFGSQFNFRIGMHTGKTVSGVVGVIKYAFDIWGDSVNTAARMEENSEPGKINISEDTYKLVKKDFICTPRGQVEVKNKGSMQMYFVEGPQS
ncbi:MAG: adenylate cyclase [Bacteroidia bacterium]|jgi:adenylate cyclase